MKTGKMPGCVLGALWLVVAGVPAGVSAQTCEEAWAAYNEFRQRNVMAPEQYPLTEYGARVRAACGKDALPVPEGSDTPHRSVIRKPPKPKDKPAEKPVDKPAAPTASPPPPDASRSLPRN